MTKERNVVIIGLGYVGLPLMCLLARRLNNVFGYDTDKERVASLRSGENVQNILNERELEGLPHAELIDELRILSGQTVFIVAVPTPVNEDKFPDLTPLLTASHAISSVLKSGDIVVYESTVYPGATREICVPALEAGSGLSLGKDFSIGYSPERVNPGDEINTIDKVIKIVSASDEATLLSLQEIYSKVCNAGLHLASSIEVAEAAKVIENIQRDVNIALVNEFETILDKIGVPIQDTLQAAATKWNFINFRPGLVGGHCIGVDPYYFIYKAKAVSAEPRIIEAARYTNEHYRDELIYRFLQWCVREKVDLGSASLIFYGMTFKPDCADMRNSQMTFIVGELRKFGLDVDIYDPIAGINELSVDKKYDVLLVGTAHGSLLEDLKSLDSFNPKKYYRLVSSSSGLPEPVRQFNE